MELSLPEPTASGLTSGVTREILPNGLTILIKENHAAPVAAVLVSVKAGYFQEADRVNGIAHVIEHMLFKGTPRRPADEQIAREVRELGGYINAGTYYEETTYYITVPVAARRRRDGHTGRRVPKLPASTATNWRKR